MLMNGFSFKKFDGMPEQNYKLMPNSKTPAKLITRIPFYHPVQLFKITQVSLKST
jgi:hypothetical protein